MADEPKDEFVYVRLGSDTSAAPGRVTREAYDTIWKAKGFSLVDTDEAEVALSPQTQAEMAAAEPAPTTTSKKS